jgi:hypothetical protein
MQTGEKGATRTSSPIPHRAMTDTPCQLSSEGAGLLLHLPHCITFQPRVRQVQGAQRPVVHRPHTPMPHVHHREASPSRRGAVHMLHAECVRPAHLVWLSVRLPTTCGCGVPKDRLEVRQPVVIGRPGTLQSCRKISTDLTQPSDA